MRKPHFPGIKIVPPPRRRKKITCSFSDKNDRFGHCFRKFIEQAIFFQAPSVRPSVGVGCLLMGMLVLSMCFGSGCGRALPASGNREASIGTRETPRPSEPSVETDPTRAAQSPAQSPAPSSATASGRPAGTEESGYPQDPAIRDVFAANDFEVPVGSHHDKSEWLRLIRAAMEEALPLNSASKPFVEAFHFQVAPSAGSGEWRVDCAIVVAAHEPGAKDPFGPWGPEAQGVVMTVLEQADALSCLDVQFEYEQRVIPDVVIDGLLAQYRFWMEQWNRAASKGVAPIHSVETPIPAIPVVKRGDPFLTPFEGTVEADLDGDGIREVVHAVYDMESRLVVTAGNAVLHTWYDNPEGVYLVDLDTRDNRIEIAIADHGPSSDETTLLYALEEDAFVEVGAVSGILFQGDGKGRISTYARSWQGPLLTWFFDIEYELSEGRVAMMPTRWYASSVPVTMRVELPLYTQPDASAAEWVLPEGTRATITLSDVSEWFRLDGPDGRQGWIRFVDAEHLLLPDGSRMHQLEAMDGIVAAD